MSRVSPSTAPRIFDALDRERAVRRDGEGAVVEQVVQLNRDAAAVRLAHAEPDRSERRRQKRRVHRLGHGRRELAAIDEVLERPEARDVGLGFLDGAVGVLQRLPHGGGLAVHGDAVRPSPCISSCIRMCVKNASNDDVRPIGRRERDLRDRHQHAIELRLLHVLQHDPLGALLADDALVVRQVVGGRLHAAIAVAGGEDDVDDADRRQARRASGCGATGRSAGGPRSPAARRRSAASFADSASSRTVMNASNAAL